MFTVSSMQGQEWAGSDALVRSRRPRQRGRNSGCQGRRTWRRDQSRVRKHLTPVAWLCHEKYTWNHNRYTPLHVACHFGSLSMVRFLLLEANGSPVRVDVQNELGYTPLHQASQQGHLQIVNLLLENNASPNTVSNVSTTSQSHADISKRGDWPCCSTYSCKFNRDQTLCVVQRTNCDIVHESSINKAHMYCYVT